MFDKNDKRYKGMKLKYRHVSSLHRAKTFARSKLLTFAVLMSEIHPWLPRATKYWDYLDPAKAPWTIYMAVCRGKGMRYNAYGSWDQKHIVDRNRSH